MNVSPSDRREPGTSEGTAPSGTAPEDTTPDGNAPKGTAPGGTAPEGDTPQSAERPNCPVRAVRAGTSGRSGYLVTGYAEARWALGDPRLSKDTAAFFAGKGSQRRLHPAVTRHMLASDPPHHTRQRKLVTKAFTTRAVASLRPFIERVTNALLDQWPAPGGEVDIVAELAVPLPVTVICELLGVPESDRSNVRGWSADLFAAGRPDRTDASSYALGEYMTGLIAERRKRPGDALLDHLISVRDGGDRLSEDELVSLAVLLVVAGHETTTNFLGSALLALLRQPAALQRLRAEPHLLAGALDELLRHSSPVSTATFRYTTEPVTLGGVEIPADTPVHVGIGAANRDPAHFPSPDPDQVDLDRDATGHLAFGHGIHRCVGAPLARAETEIALRTLLSRYPNLRLAVPPDQLTLRPTRLVRGLTALPVLL